MNGLNWTVESQVEYRDRQRSSPSYVEERLEAGDYSIALLGMEIVKLGCRNSLPWVMGCGSLLTNEVLILAINCGIKIN